MARAMGSRKGHGNVRLQRPAAEALGEAWQECRSNDDRDAARNRGRGRLSGRPSVARCDRAHGHAQAFVFQ
jgi:hypothetical protein